MDNNRKHTEQTGRTQVDNLPKKSVYGARIKEVRKIRGETQAEFATHGGVTARAQRNYEDGFRTPDIDYLAGLSAAGVDIAYILTGDWHRFLSYSEAEAFDWLGERMHLERFFQAGAVDIVANAKNGKISLDDMNAQLERVFQDSRVDLIESGALHEAITVIEAALVRQGLTARPEKKASAIVALLHSYRVSREFPSGFVDQVALLAAD